MTATLIFGEHDAVLVDTLTSVLLQRFPEARAIATPKSVELMRTGASRQPLYRKLWPGQLPDTIAAGGL